MARHSLNHYHYRNYDQKHDATLQGRWTNFLTSTMKEKKGRIVLCGVATTVLIVFSIILATMMDVVDNNQAGLLVDEFSGAVLEKKSYSTGQYLLASGALLSNLIKRFIR